MMTALWVVIIHVIELITIGGYLLVTKNSKLEKTLIEQQQYIDALSVVIADADETIHKLDVRGAFEADDEVGTFFKSLKEIQVLLNQFNNSQN
jgi:hypothetical protein